MVKVSICIPTYNRSDYLQYAVNSVLKQTYTDFELIVCDDGSSDNTPEVVSQWNDSRIRYIRHPENIGRSRNMRSGFNAAQGKYFIKFDDDDGLTPEFLARTVTVLDSNPSVDFVCSDHWIINPYGEKDELATKKNSTRWGKDRLKQGLIPNFLREAFDYQSLQVGSTLFRHAALEEIDFMRGDLLMCEDFDLFVRLALAGKQGYFLPELLMEYRFHGGQTSLSQDIDFLSAKTVCLNSYQFDDAELETIRLQKLAGIQRTLGLRLIEQGETQKGRECLQKYIKHSGNSNRASFGLFLSYLPVTWRQFIFKQFRNIRTKDYSEKVRVSI